MLSAALLAVALSSRADAVPIADTPNAVRINGEVSEAAWQAATPMDGFLQREPEEGGQPSQRTEFRVVYDATTLYVKVRAFDTQADKIVSYLTRRDADSPSDWLHVFVDSYHDRRTAYEFAVNPSGVKIDRYWFDDNNRDDGWDAVWDAKVTRDASGWTAEFHIPFSQLRFNPNGANTFGFAVARRIGRLNETSTWPLLARSATGYVSSFGELSGLTMTASPKRLEMLERLRDVLLGAASLLRRRVGHVPIRFRLHGRSLSALLLAPRRTIAAGCRRAPERRRHLRAVSDADDNPWRGQTDGTRRQIFDRRHVRRDTGGIRNRARRDAQVPAADRAAHDVFDRPRATRVRRSIVARLHGHGGEPSIDRDDEHLAEQRLHRRRRLGRPLQIALQRHRLPGRQQRARQRGRDRRHRGEQPPLFPASRRDDASSRSGGDFARRRERPRRHQQDWRSARPVQFTGRLQVARLRAERRRIPAAR
ncbi:MAG: hypothetical protein DMG04_29635 [Acidobacteria bacterium]|nr:MAG: hypothetical protein DMG04_29635 [Acidobacteriota bacterium]